MATKSQKKASKAAACVSLASPALRQMLMNDAYASAATAATRPSTPQRPPAEQPTESALLQLIKAEMGISRQQLGDIIKKEMASLHAEIKDLEALRQEAKADIASLKIKKTNLDPR